MQRHGSKFEQIAGAYLACGLIELGLAARFPCRSPRLHVEGIPQFPLHVPFTLPCVHYCVYSLCYESSLAPIPYCQLSLLQQWLPTCLYPCPLALPRRPLTTTRRSHLDSGSTASCLLEDWATMGTPSLQCQRPSRPSSMRLLDLAIRPLSARRQAQSTRLQAQPFHTLQ